MRASPAAFAAPATVMSALVLVACGGPYPGATLGQQVQSWVRATGFTAAVGSLEADAARVRQVSPGDAGGLRTVCDVLVTDALSANQNLPSPDTRLTTILTDAYRAAAAAGNGCLRAAGAASGVPSRVAADLAVARSGYIKAQARVDLLALEGGGRR